MRLFSCVLLVGLAWAQKTPQPPIVRDAYSTGWQGSPSRSARLAGNLKVVVCKAEYEAWVQAQNPVPDLSLFLEGMLIKGTFARKPVTPSDAPSDDQTSKVKTQCAAANSASTAAKKAADDSEADAKAAADHAANEKDANKADAAKNDAVQKAAVAKVARENANVALQEARTTYVLTFDLSPQLAAKADPKDDSWRQLLARPWDSGPVAVSIGPASAPWPSDVTIPFERINSWWLAGWAVLFVFSIVLFVRYARSSDIIRDTGTLPPGANGVTPRKAFSLARTQMAVWTFLVAGALAFIFLITWNENTITSGVLILIGISSGTTLLAATADGTNPSPQPTQGLMTDLLTDGTGPSFQRYQMVLFTVILAVIFVFEVARNLGMPEFDITLLGLMGISNGTYLGFKLQGR